MTWDPGEKLLWDAAEAELEDERRKKQRRAEQREAAREQTRRNCIKKANKPARPTHHIFMLYGDNDECCGFALTEREAVLWIERAAFREPRYEKLKRRENR